MQNFEIETSFCTKTNFGPDQFLDRIPLDLNWLTLATSTKPQIQTQNFTLTKLEQSLPCANNICSTWMDRGETTNETSKTAKYLFVVPKNKNRKRLHNIFSFQRALAAHKKKIQIRFPDQPKPFYAETESVCLWEDPDLDPMPTVFTSAEVKQQMRHNFMHQLQFLWDDSKKVYEHLPTYSRSIRGVLRTMLCTAPSDRSLATVRLSGNLVMMRIAEIWPDLYAQLVPFTRIVLLFSVFSDLKETARPAAEALIDSYQEDILTYHWIANICLSRPSQHPLISKMKKLALAVDKLGSLLMLFARIWHRNVLPRNCIHYKCWCSDWANELIIFFPTNFGQTFAAIRNAKTNDF